MDAVLHRAAGHDYDTAKKSDTARFGQFFWAMMDRGVYLPCSQFEAAFLSAAMTERHIDETIAAARDSLEVAGTLRVPSGRSPQRTLDNRVI